MGWQIMKLEEHIKLNYKTKTAFAESIGTTKQQVHRWIKLDCIWHNGKVYQPKT